MTKARKAIAIDGPAFLNVLAPCNRGWRSQTNDAITLSKAAVASCYWPLYEIEDGKLKVNSKPKEKLPLDDFIKPQGRFKHLYAPENEAILKQLKEDVERRNGQLIVVAIPSKAQFMGLDGFVPYQVHLRAICQEFGIEFLDLAPHFERTFLRTYFREGIHLNARGHEVAGEAIGEYLQAREGR